MNTAMHMNLTWNGSYYILTLAGNSMEAISIIRIANDSLDEVRESLSITVMPYLGNGELDWSHVITLEADIIDNDGGGLVWTQTSQVNYHYDADDRLIAKVNVGVDWEFGMSVISSEAYYYDHNQIVLRAVNGQVNNRYLWSDRVDELLAEDQVAWWDNTNQTLWPLGDHLNTIRDIALFDGVATTVVNHREINSFGNIITVSGPQFDSVFGFTGRLWDGDTELQYNWHRWYDPQLGQWASEDPIEFRAGDGNIRRYVLNNPLSFIDPIGYYGYHFPGIYNPDDLGDTTVSSQDRYSYRGIRNLITTTGSIRFDNVKTANASIRLDAKIHRKDMNEQEIATWNDSMMQYGGWDRLPKDQRTGMIAPNLIYLLNGVVYHNNENDFAVAIVHHEGDNITTGVRFDEWYANGKFTGEAGKADQIVNDANVGPFTFKLPNCEHVRGNITLFLVYAENITVAAGISFSYEFNDTDDQAAHQALPTTNRGTRGSFNLPDRIKALVSTAGTGIDWNIDKLHGYVGLIK